MSHTVAVVAVRDKAGCLLDGSLGIACSTGNACQAHHAEVVVAIAAAEQFVGLAL